MKIFACCILLSVVAASNLNASSSTVSLNDSTLVVPFTNNSLQRPDHWPSLPYNYHLDLSLSICITRYGDLILESQEEVALAALVSIEDEMATGGGSDDEIYATILHNHGVFFSFQRPWGATLPFRRWEAVKVIHTVRILMTFYAARDLPSVKVLLGKELLSHFSVHFLIHLDSIPSSPQLLVSNNSEPGSTNLIARSNASLSWLPAPFTFRIKDNLQMTIFEYGPDFTTPEPDILDRLTRIEITIQYEGGPDEILPSVVISSRPVAIVFTAVRYPSLPLTHLQAAQAVHAIYNYCEKYGPRKIKHAEIYVVGLRAMLFSLRSSTKASGNETSFLKLDPPYNDSAPTSPALVARSNTTLSNTNMAGDKNWPSLPFTFNVEDGLDVTVLEYGANFPGPRRNVLKALATIAEIITKKGEPYSIIRTQRLAYSPVVIAFARITQQDRGALLLRVQATMVLHAIAKLMEDHKPREFTRTEISVGGEKAMGLSLELFFATVDTGNQTMEIGNTTLETGNITMEMGNTTVEIGNTNMEIGNTIQEIGIAASELGSASADIGSS